MSQNAGVLTIHSPIGMLRLNANDDTLTAIEFVETDAALHPEVISNPVLEEAQIQLNEYFNGQRKTFDLPLQPAGTAFQKEVWNELANIGYGSTIPYTALAKRLGDAKKVRAVGRANGQNPLPIIIPCHRVVGSDNKLTGYSGGIERKKWLLRHEGALLL
jgi:methylated-DNA-[protein]-cysteine S-methyltransferase